MTYNILRITYEACTAFGGTPLLKLMQTSVVILSNSTGRNAESEWSSFSRLDSRFLFSIPHRDRQTDRLSFSVLYSFQWEFIKLIPFQCQNWGETIENRKPPSFLPKSVRASSSGRGIHEESQSNSLDWPGQMDIFPFLSQWRSMSWIEM